METVVQGVVDAVATTTVSVLTTNLPTLASIFAGLVGLGIALHFVKKFIGRRA